MRHRLPSLATLIGAAAVGCLTLGVSAPASAQALVQPQPPAAPQQRYMTWANRPSTTVPGHVAAARARAANGMIPRRVAPSQSVNPPAMVAAAQPIPVSRGLTPASAWIGPRVTPAYAPGAPDPLPPIVEAPAAPAPEAPVRAAPAYTAPVAPPAPQPVQTTAADPMAPRRDAPIFRLQSQAAATPGQPAPVQTASAQTAPSAQGHEGPRYYSVHRDAGRQPDPTVMPEPVFFDSVTLDLAQPPETQAPVRDAQGRRRAVPNDDPALP